MLVLSRKQQQSVVVGGDENQQRILKVTVLEIRSGKVKLGFEADSGVPVHRLEVWERIQSENQSGKLREVAREVLPITHATRGETSVNLKSGGNQC